MKKILILLGAAALVATGCHSTDNDVNSSGQSPVYAPTGPPTHPPSPNTMNNPPATVAPPAPATPH